jgi:hypothetical protein
MEGMDVAAVAEAEEPWGVVEEDQANARRLE